MYINTLYSPYIGGGAEIILQSLAEGIKGLGHEVVVVTTGDTPGIVEDSVNSVRVLRVGIANVYWQFNTKKPPAWKRGIWHLRDVYNLTMGSLVKEIISSEQPDVINTHNLAGFSASIWNTIEHSGVPSVHVLHDLYHLCPNSNMFGNDHACASQCIKCKAFRLFTPQISNSVNAVIGVSHYILDRHLENGLFKDAKIKTAIHNTQAIAQKAPRQKREGDKIRFGFLGTLALVKGIELLLDVFAHLSLPNAELWIAGRGQEEYQIKLKSKESSSIRFLGYTKPEEFFSSIDVLVVPSLWHDTLPSVVFEAFAYGVPVIGSRRGGIPEMIKEGINGYLFEPKAPIELANILRNLSDSPEAIVAMQPNITQSAIEYMDRDGWLNKYDNVYKQLTLMHSA